MRLISLKNAKLCVLLILLSLMPLVAQAHLMVPQRGTLNIVDDGAYLVLSVPVLAFTGVDDNQDGLLSFAELEAHQNHVIQQVAQHIALNSQQKRLNLQGIMLSLSPEHSAGVSTPNVLNAEQIIVLGKFVVSKREANDARLLFSLFGQQAAQQQMRVLITQAQRQNQLVFTPSNTQLAVFAPLSSVVSTYLKMGVAHILTGFDHLLFLLVLLMTGGRISQLLWLLTAFTVGHALTLGGSVLYGITLPSAIVEPLIAASILAMAVFEKLKSRIAPSHFTRLRLALVFAFSLIHGLGFASSLSELGLDKNHLIASLLGFNVGIELGQLLFASAILMLAHVFMTLFGQGRLHQARGQLYIAAMAISSVWMLQRIMGF